MRSFENAVGFVVAVLDDEVLGGLDGCMQSGLLRSRWHRFIDGPEAIGVGDLFWGLLMFFVSFGVLKFVFSFWFFGTRTSISSWRWAGEARETSGVAFGVASEEVATQIFVEVLR